MLLNNKTTKILDDFSLHHRSLLQPSPILGCSAIVNMFSKITKTIKKHQFVDINLYKKHQCVDVFWISKKRGYINTLIEIFRCGCLGFYIKYAKWRYTVTTIINIQNAA